MFNMTAGRKSQLFQVGVLLALLLALSSFALPARAAPPESLEFIFDVTYYNVPTLLGSGNWSSSGPLAGSGELAETYHDSGWDPEGCWRTVHPTSILAGPTPQDTITIHMQTVRVQAEPGCATFSAEGNWVILSATGIYAGLRGRGQATISGGGVQPGQGDTLDFVVHSELLGQGHFQ